MALQHASSASDIIADADIEALFFFLPLALDGYARYAMLMRGWLIAAVASRRHATHCSRLALPPAPPFRLRHCYAAFADGRLR